MSGPRPVRARIALRRPLDLARTLTPLRHGLGDRTIRLAPGTAWLAFRTPDGPATLRLAHSAPLSVEVVAWGPGADEAARSAATLIGEEDEPERLVVRHGVLRRLQRVHEGLRLPRSGRMLHALVPSVIEQKVTGTEAFRAYVALLRRYGDPAPGPAGLMLPPVPRVLARLPYHAFHPLGVERRRAEVIRRAAAVADWLEAARDSAEATRRLRSLPGIGEWTAAEVVRSVFGDADAVSVGDYHVPNMVSWALAREPRADDARMLELLEPYRGQRGRVQRYLEVGMVHAPRFGARMAPRSIGAI